MKTVLKTVFQRGLSLVMCLILVCTTMSVTAFAADDQESFSYKTYAQNVTKENVHFLLDFAEDELKKINFRDTISINLILTTIDFVIDFTSIDAACDTLYRFRGIIDAAALLLGDLSSLNMDAFKTKLSRSESGDYGVFCALLEFAKANAGIVEKFINGTLDVGSIGDLVLKKLGITLSSINISDIIKGKIVELLFAGADDYDAIKAAAFADFDKFIFADVLGALVASNEKLNGIEITTDTTLDSFFTNIFDLLLNTHLPNIMSDPSFASLAQKFGNVVVFDNFKGVTFSEKPLLEEINSVFGDFVGQIMPNYNNWTDGDYSVIGTNIENVIRYIVAETGFIANAKDLTNEEIMLKLGKKLLSYVDAAAYESVVDATSLAEVTNKLVLLFLGDADKTYPDGTTYEHILGDSVINSLGGAFPLIDENGKTMTADSSHTVWEALNSALNFLLVDKKLNNFFGINVTKESTFFDKLDVILDFTADDGTAEFNSKDYFDALLDSVFNFDLQKIINLTAAKALGNGRDKATISAFANATVYNLLNNWSKKSTGANLTKWSKLDGFLSRENLGEVAKALLTVWNARKEGTAYLLGLVAHLITDIRETTGSKDSTCSYTGYKYTKTCLKCNKAYLKGDTIAKKDHIYDKGVITKPATCTAAGIKTYTCTVCKGKKTETIKATGHKWSGWSAYTKASYVADGKNKRICYNCKRVEYSTVKRLTLKKPTGLKFSTLSTSSIKFSWNKVTGAQAYTLYYKTGSGGWKSVTTTKNYATVKKLKAGTTYSFKVAALTGKYTEKGKTKYKYKSSYSSTVSSITNPAAASIKRAVSKKKKEIVVEWKKISGVSGYEVTYSTSKKFTKKTTKTAKVKASATKGYIKKLKSKKTYYVKVRAYKTFNKKPVYGAYSKTKTVKCK